MGFFCVILRYSMLAAHFTYIYLLRIFNDYLMSPTGSLACIYCNPDQTHSTFNFGQLFYVVVI